MNAIFSQDSRLGRLTTVLGKDALVLLRFEGDDHVNDLFEYSVDALSTVPNIDFDKLIGTHASVELESQGYGTRIFDGIVTRARWAGVGENGNKYALTLQPWFWIAGRRRNQRIFHNQTVEQILTELLKDYAGLGDPALLLKLTKSYPKLEYTVQYRESDLAFATRMMERFGISYHFTHAMGSHTLVLTDDVHNHDAIAGGSRNYKAAVRATQTGREHFWEWHPERRMTTGAMRLTEYNFKTPNAAMEVDQTGEAKYAQGDIESYDWPGDYLTQSAGQGVVNLRTDQERGQDDRHRAIGDCTSLGAGMTLKLTGDQVNGVGDAEYLCLVARHAYTSDGYGSGAEGGEDGFAYTGEYIFMPVDTPLAPERKTPVPLVHGPQTAVVVGDGEIDCDEYGRILVHFHWDLEKAYSMRCRVSQNWASKGWGGMVIPRIGMEVVVEFLEGDPDKPLVTGCVYNGQNDAPYALPQHKTKSVFRTDTHQGEGFNEISFEDSNGDEQIYIHAEMDQDIVVKNDLREWVKNDTHLKVDNNQNEDVKANKSSTVGKNRIDATAKTHSASVGKDSALSVGDKFSVVAGESVFMQAGKATVIESKGDLVIKAPGGFIRIGADGITIRGTKVNINSGGSPFNGVVGEALTPQIPDEAKVKK